MEHANRRNSRCRRPKGCRRARGFTLIEVMIAMVVLALGMLASVMGIMAVLDHGRLNELRTEAVKIAQEQAEALANTPYATISSIAGTEDLSPIVRTVRNSTVTYNVSETYTSKTGAGGAAISKVKIYVTWDGREGNQTEQFHYELDTMVGQN